ncbi:hypothetical protein Gohar_013745 [Gossypium harknessii]|uniref:Uncharacterized protein n=1 Tax=Gossypium harknessii TaxID=34285 RepID=A0A7J9H1R4_9ROSI|nr:hypothetical protein [Gossypium harknessii]
MSTNISVEVICLLMISGIAVTCGNKDQCPKSNTYKVVMPFEAVFYELYVFAVGFEPVQYIAGNESVVLGDHNKYMIQLWNGTPMEIVKREPYLAFALLFLCFRVLLSVFPEVLSRLKAFWVSYAPHLNLEIFGETSQLFARALHMVDVRRVWTKLKLCKTRNFHQGAKSAHVWASSLASVSLGESSGRSSSSS